METLECATPQPGASLRNLLEIPSELQIALKDARFEYASRSLQELENSIMSEHLDYHAKLREELKALLDAFDDTIIVLSTRHIYIPVKPQAKQSARFGSGFASQPTKKKQYVANLRAKFEDEYKGVSPTIRPVRLTIYYCFPWTKTDIKSGKADRELWGLFMPVPDLENMTKPLKDAMAGVVFMNDSQVVEEKVRKIRWPDPGIMIKVEEIKAKPIARPSGTPYTAG